MSENDIKQIIELYSVQNKSISYISKLFNCNRYRIRKILVDNLIEIRDNNFYKSKYVNENFLSSKDYELLNKIKDILHSEHKIGFCINNNGYGKGNESCYLSINNKNIVSDLINDGVVYNKSNILKFPEYDIVPNHLIRHFIRGYFDGDGSVYNGNSGICVSFEGTQSFLNSLLDVLKDVTGTKSSVYKYKNKDHYSIKIGGRNQVKSFYNFIYNNATIFLGRKKMVFEDNLF